MLRRLSFLLKILLIGLLITSCKAAGKSEKCYKRQEKNKAAAEQKAYENKVQDHRDIQSKETLKMLKKTEKEAKKLNKSKKPKSKPC